MPVSKEMLKNAKHNIVILMTRTGNPLNNHQREVLEEALSFWMNKAVEEATKDTGGI